MIATGCCALFLATDLIWMRIPWWTVGAGLALAIVTALNGDAVYLFSGVMAGVVCLIAEMPGGDVKAAAVLGLFVPAAQMRWRYP